MFSAYPSQLAVEVRMGLKLLVVLKSCRINFLNWIAMHVGVFVQVRASGVVCFDDEPDLDTE